FGRRSAGNAAGFTGIWRRVFDPTLVAQWMIPGLAMIPGQAWPPVSHARISKEFQKPNSPKAGVSAGGGFRSLKAFNPPKSECEQGKMDVPVLLTLLLPQEAATVKPPVSPNTAWKRSVPWPVAGTEPSARQRSAFLLLVLAV